MYWCACEYAYACVCMKLCRINFNSHLCGHRDMINLMCTNMSMNILSPGCGARLSARTAAESNFMY